MISGLVTQRFHEDVEDVAILLQVIAAVSGGFKDKGQQRHYLTARKKELPPRKVKRGGRPHGSIEGSGTPAEAETVSKSSGSRFHLGISLRYSIILLRRCGEHVHSRSR